MQTEYLINGDIIALHKFRTIYFAIPKVANSSMKAICADLIRDSLDEHFVRTFWNNRWKPRIFRNASSRRQLADSGILLSRKQLAKHERYWKFCLVRNPWDRIVSCWKQKIKNAGPSNCGAAASSVAANLAAYGMFHADMSFDEFVHAVADIPDEDANAHFRSQYTFVIDEQGELVVDYVGRLENIEAELDYIFRTSGIPKQTIPHLLKIKRHPYGRYYTRETRDLIAERFARDITLFNYSFDSLASSTPTCDG